jgi:hypothetical protein
MSNISLQKKRDKTVQGTDDAWVQIILGGEHCALPVIFSFWCGTMSQIKAKGHSLKHYTAPGVVVSTVHY